jgi:hypothetical protein
MGKKGDIASISRDPPLMLDHSRGALTNAVPEFTAAIMPMHADAYRTAGGNVACLRRPHFVAGDF